MKRNGILHEPILIFKIELAGDEMNANGTSERKRMREREKRRNS